MQLRESVSEPKRRRWVIPFFLTLGFIFLAIGTIFFMQLKGHSWYEIIYILAFEAAIIFFTATIIETLLLSEFGNRAVETMEKLGKATQDSIAIRLNAVFELLRNAEYNGIINILPARRDASKDQNGKEQSQLSFLSISEALKKSKKVKILCISGREFLWPREKSGFYDIFLNKARNSQDFEVQILLAHDGEAGYGARIRGKREDPKEPDYILNDVERSRKETDKLNSDARKGVIKIQYYNFFPQAWLVITDDKMFLEPYHMGSTEFLKNRWKEQFPDNDPCCGGRVPILVVQKPSPLYDAMDNYFDWLWSHNDQNIFGDNLSDFRKYLDVVEVRGTADNNSVERTCNPRRSR